MTTKKPIGICVVQTHSSKRRSLRDRFSRWITPRYIRWLVRRESVVILVGVAGTGKTTLLRKSHLELVDGMAAQNAHRSTNTASDAQPELPGALPDTPFAVDEVSVFDGASVSRALVKLRGRGFVLAVQQLNDLEHLGVVDELVEHHRVEFVYLDRGINRECDEAESWVRRMWAKKWAKRIDASLAA